MDDSSGGFLPYSPPPSSVTSSRAAQSLPHPRSTPLKAGGTKESSFIRHVDQQLLHIQRRFAKRDAVQAPGQVPGDEQGRVIDDGLPPAVLAESERWQDVPGYRNFAEAGRDVEALLDVIWISGTPSLQIPYLIALALLTSTLITGFPASPRQLFRLIDKLDHAFASLLQGQDVETSESLPGFDLGRKVSVTEKVRIKSLVERTRVSVANLMASGEVEEDDEPVEGDLVLDDEDDIIGSDDNDWSMSIAKVYDKTLLKIGDSMDGSAIGIYTGL